ncbi:alpha beta hydrolase fold protein [Colletotrichum karsti]|uniref:Alpha beta hydrolase fold protein n=1 Tax=Colletotrichum karsti TaxID=1095194 RepID=A0A9P6LFV0_9PEZI|nr:alpha beta hydrolase fold protein [Colletotrichum karsti]KAF9874529.1 alpha beta hydrolase fold protein [Colletotrichum karsti]
MHVRPIVSLAVATLVGMASSSYTTKYLTGASNNTIQVLVEGNGPALLVWPSFARDSIEDFHEFSTALAGAGYRVLRPQPRGMGESTGPVDTTWGELGADVLSVIDTFGNGKAVVLGHAAGQRVTKYMAATYPEKVPSIVLACISTGLNPNATISATATIASNYTNSVEDRLAALELGYFAPGHNASVWLTGWYPEAVGAVSGTGVDTLGANTTQILDVIATLDPWRKEDQWNYTTNLAGNRSTMVFVDDASHALFPENLQGLLDVLLPWLKLQTSSWK